MMSLIDILKLTLPLSRLLQTKSLDTNLATKAVSNTMSTLKDRRLNCEENFSKIFAEVKELADELDVEVKLPRFVGRQTKRANHPGGPEEYYRRSIYIPLLDNVCTDLTSRLHATSLECLALRGIIPTLLTESQGEKEVELLKDLKKAVEQFAPIMDIADTQTNIILFEGELDLWRNHWKNEKERNAKLPDEVTKVLDVCDANTFPIIHNLLKILATLPVSVATAERSFSTLRRVKTWLRARMGETRLTGLCLLHVHRDIEVDTEKVIERFAHQQARRLEFVV
uniref:52 kDa repressor of the inhibitor of the protein kinase-like n=1 Tax=Diabrotica virgifera virgifera TaxID=50390 RepID=A0A6P7GLU4_DIAVI